jgi:ketosteroid isomerase-like protein
MRTAFENFFDGAGRAATVEIEELRERGELVFVRVRIHARGTSSGAEVVSPPVGVVYMFSDGRVFRIEWHYGDLDKALAEFERSG